MNKSHIEHLHHLSAAQKQSLLDIVDSGIDDPCTSLAYVNASTIRLWYDNLPHSNRKGGAIKDVRDMLLKKGNTQVRWTIVSKMGGQFATCNAFDAYLRGWLSHSKHATFLEAVVWGWLNKVSALTQTDIVAEEQGKVLTCEDAANHPEMLLSTLSCFKRQFKLYSMKPRLLLDQIAMSQGWWTEESESRGDIFVLSSIEESLQEHEWVCKEEILNKSIELGSLLVGSALERLISRQSVIYMEGCDGVTTPELFYCSKSVKGYIKEYASQDADVWQLFEVLAPLRERLMINQRDVLMRVMSGKRLTLCCSPAGTGKTYTAGVIASHVPNGVLCLAPTWKAISVLRSKLQHVACVTFQTVQGFVTSFPPSKVGLVIVDEVSMLTMGQLRQILFSYLNQTQTRLLLIGDDAQLPCIGRGYPIRDIQTQVHTVVLTQCMRTQVGGLLEAAQAVRNGVSFEGVGSEVTLTATHTPVQCMSNFFDAKEGVQPPWSDTYLQMITPQNNHVELLNTMVQEMLTKKEGSISFSKCFVGDAVRISENTETYKNGQEGILTDIKPISVGSSTTGNGGNKRDCRGNGKSGIEFQDRTGCVMLEDGTSVSVKEGHILPAYATTVHRVQGSEYANVALVVFKDTHPNLLSREMIYTSVTRAKEALHVVGNVFVINGCQKMERRTVFDFV